MSVTLTSVFHVAGRSAPGLGMSPVTTRPGKSSGAVPAGAKNVYDASPPPGAVRDSQPNRPV